MRAIRTAAAMSLLAALLIAPTASAASSAAAFTIDIDFVAGTEDFESSTGPLCESGSATSDAFIAGGGRQERGALTFHVIKTVTCDDGSGTFQIRVEASSTGDGTIGGFSVVAGSGTGDYVGLRGAGTVHGTFSENAIFDEYVGRLTLPG